jgi:L-asparaginase
MGNKQKMKKKLPAIVIHGGAGPKLTSRIQEERAHESLKRIVTQAFEKLSKGDSSIDVTIWVAVQLEDDPLFNAGTGAKLQRDGIARLSASLMDGATGKFSGVMNLENTKNPILVAQKLQREKDRVLAGEGAQKFARSCGFEHYNPVTQQSFDEWQQRSEKKNDDELTQLIGTIGVVCVDLEGKLSAATSTGGKGMEIIGRVGDSPTVAGNYATSSAAISCTGVGEELVDEALAVKIVVRVEDGMSLMDSFERSFEEFKIKKGRGGAIGVDKTGAVYALFTTPCMLHAIRTPDHEYIFPE